MVNGAYIHLYSFGMDFAVSGDSLYNKVIDVETLLGNTEEFAELG